MTMVNIPLLVFLLFLFAVVAGLVVGSVLSFVAPLLDIRHLRQVSRGQFALVGVVLSISYPIFVMISLAVFTSLFGVHSVLLISALNIGLRLLFAVLFTNYGWRHLGNVVDVSVRSVEFARSLGFTLLALELFNVILFVGPRTVA